MTGRIDTTVDELERASEALATEGRYTEAIGALTAANRRSRSSERDRRLVQLRRLGFARLAPPPAPQPWPRALPDPFPEVEGHLPETRVGDLTAAMIGGAIAHHGALVVRGLLDDGEAAARRDDIDRSFAACDVALAGGEAGSSGELRSDGDASWFVAADPSLDERRKRLRQSHALFASDAPRVAFDLFELLERRNLPDLIAEHFVERPTVSINKFTLRRVAPDAGPAAWHQDGAFLGPHVRALNLWIALTSCGGDITDTPGLALVPRRVDELLETGTGAGVVHGIGNDVVKERYGDEIVRPRFHAGDALLFDERFLHKTGRRRGMTKPRYAVECWFFPRSSYPEQYPGLLV